MMIPASVVTSQPTEEDPPSMDRSPVLGGVMARVIAMVFLSAMLAIVKWCATQGVPLMEIMFFRNAFAMVPICAHIAMSCGFGVLKTRRPFAHLTRSSIGLFGMFTGFAALQHLPLTEATAIGFASPLFMVALS